MCEREKRADLVGQIAGIASVGPQFEPAITAGFQIKADLEFGTGFDVSVCFLDDGQLGKVRLLVGWLLTLFLQIPDNSSLVLDLANRNGSSQHGL